MKNKSRYRWIIFVSVLFTYLVMSSQRTAPGLITDQLMIDFQVTAAVIGLVASVQFFVYTGLQVPMGLLADRYGPNFFLIIGAALTGIGTIMYSLSSHVWLLFLARILTGVGDATIWVNLVLILSYWFSAKEFSRLIGVAGMTGSLGWLMATVPFAVWIDLLGWRLAFLTSGILLVILGILLYFILVKKPKQSMFSQSKVKKEKTSLIIKRIFSSRQAWGLFLCHFGIVGGYIGFIGSWAVPFGMDMYGITRFQASELIMVSLIGALVGAPIIGWISSQINKIKIPYSLFYLITIFCWAYFLFVNGKPSILILYILFFIIGFSFGSNSLTFATVRKTFPVAESGLVTGFANTGGFLSAVLLPSIYGYVLDYFKEVNGSFLAGYHYGFLVPFLFSMLGFVGVMMIKESIVVIEKEQANI